MSNKQNLVWHKHGLSQEQREKMKGQKACVLWFTGLSGSGKSTIANIVEAKLQKMNKHTYLLDGDNVRLGLNSDLGFSDKDRVENIRRVGEVSKLFVDAGVIVLSAFISPFMTDRKLVRDLVPEGKFIEIFIDTPLSICEKRDPKGLYKKARDGEIENFTGISSPYEEPVNPELHICTDVSNAEDSADEIIAYLQQKGYLNA